MSDKEETRIIEAALFISARPMALEELRTLTGIGALGYLKKVVEDLQAEYKTRNSAIEILDADGKYEMRLKPELTTRVKQFAQDSEISKPALRTLAFVSKHDGVLKSELAKRIGSTVYQDVRELVDAGFVNAKKAGRSSRLFLTEKFHRYFEKSGVDIAQSIPTSAVEPVQVQEAQTTL